MQWISDRHFRGAMYDSQGRRLRLACDLLIRGGAHTYAKCDDQFPELAPAFIQRARGGHVWNIWSVPPSASCYGNTNSSLPNLLSRTYGTAEQCGVALSDHVYHAATLHGMTTSVVMLIGPLGFLK